MIQFQTLRYKNFLSTGDSFTEIDLNSHATTLVVGANGSGKSTMLDALSFGLFGKPHRNINKPQLVNSINGKNCVVEVEFAIGSFEYKIVRGIKPGIFEIYQNGNLLNQESHSRDYQKILEQNILKLNHKSFHQIVVLGSSSFVPFMQLPTQHRREVIEDLLDINIFTKMNTILKERIAKLRESLNHVNYNIELASEKIKIQEKYISDLKSKNDEYRQKNLDKVEVLKSRMTELAEDNRSKMESLLSNTEMAQSSLDSANERKSKLKTYEFQIKNNIQSLVKEVKFYEENSNCPTCNQIIQEVFKEEKLNSGKIRAKELSEARDKISDEIKKAESEIEKASNTLRECLSIQNLIQSNNREIDTVQNQITDIQKDTETQSGSDVSDAENSLFDLKNQLVELTADRSKHYEEGSYNQALSEMLKDTGIKTKVVKQYLPVINRLINGYLQVLDFFVSFHLDESFTETIRSRHRDDFSYASFSEGEKQRIDLALLFTWRQVARIKNSISTNLLMLDETFDSSMDADGVENLLKILNTLEDNTRVFIISHKTDALDGKFDNKIEFVKYKNFSKIK